MIATSDLRQFLLEPGECAVAGVRLLVEEDAALLVRRLDRRVDVDRDVARLQSNAEREILGEAARLALDDVEAGWSDSPEVR